MRTPDDRTPDDRTPDDRTPDDHHGADARFAGLFERALALADDTVALRRSVHRHPELGLRLPHTQRAVLDALADLPLEVHTGQRCDSVVAVLRGGRPGPAVLLRGDMDALPLTERTGLDFASTVDGVMHACGHDGHTAMLASAARLLCGVRESIAGSVIFMFQPGEEGYHGAREMIDDGVLDAAGVDVVGALAVHLSGSFPAHEFVCRPGPMMAAAHSFTVRVRGRGGHASMPHDACDPVPAAAEMVGALQSMLTRRVDVFDPAVLTVGRITAGTTSNIIPELAELEGTLRTLSDRTTSLLLDRLRTVCTHVGAAHDCTVEVSVDAGYPVTVNDDGQARRVLALADECFGVGHGVPMPDPMMGGEDFSYVLQRVPGAIAFLGACPPEVPLDTAPANHSDRVIFDESALPYGVAMYAAYALDLLR